MLITELLNKYDNPFPHERKRPSVHPKISDIYVGISEKLDHLFALCRP